MWGDRCALKLMARPSCPASLGKKGAQDRDSCGEATGEQAFTRASPRTPVTTVGLLRAPRATSQHSSVCMINCLQLSARRAHLAPPFRRSPGSRLPAPL